MRLARESATADETDGSSIDADALMENDAGEDKTFAAMGVAKTIGTVRIYLFPFCRSLIMIKPCLDHLCR